MRKTLNVTVARDRLTQQRIVFLTVTPEQVDGELGGYAIALTPEEAAQLREGLGLMLQFEAPDEFTIPLGDGRSRPIED